MRYALFSRRTSQIRITAPTNDTIMEPVKPEADSPNKPNTKRPITPPTIPSTMSIGTPYPPPFMTFPASHPAIKPTMTAQINPLSISSSFRLHCATCANNADGCPVGPPRTQKPRATRVHEEDRLSERAEGLRRPSHHSAGVWRGRCPFKHAVADGSGSKD